MLGQRRPQTPQLFTSFNKLTSHPSLSIPLQLAYGYAQLDIKQFPELQKLAAFGKLHCLLHVPQLLILLKRLVSQPSDTRPLQLPNPELQVPTPQIPDEQVARPLMAGQTVLHVPQLAMSVETRVSQPLALLPSQSA
jgi:hypothetical protein